MVIVWSTIVYLHILPTQQQTTCDNFVVCHTPLREKMTATQRRSRHHFHSHGEKFEWCADITEHLEQVRQGQGSDDAWRSSTHEEMGWWTKLLRSEGLWRSSSADELSLSCLGIVWSLRTPLRVLHLYSWVCSGAGLRVWRCSMSPLH